MTSETEIDREEGSATLLGAEVLSSAVSEEEVEKRRTEELDSVMALEVVVEALCLELERGRADAPAPQSPKPD